MNLSGPLPVSTHWDSDTGGGAQGRPPVDWHEDVSGEPGVAVWPGLAVVLSC